jgi:4-amino-4-deoxy-L-arabinose transferase-like glycosyltransferase
MIGSLIGVSLIAKLLGGNSEVQLFSSLAALTIPMGILQSTSTQNDYVATFWLVCFVCFALISTREQTIATYLLAGISLGLAILTKSTSMLFAAPFLIWTGLVLLKKLRQNIWKPAGIVTLAVLVINSGYFARNLSLFGNPLGLTEEATDGLIYKYTNDIYTLQTVTSNALRNVGFQLISPFEKLNILVSTIILKLHDSLGIDPNDPRITWTGTAFRVSSWSVHEDTASNPWHSAFILISLLLLLNFRNQDARIYAASLVAGFLLFCLILKWQPWHSRLLLPLFVLAMPLSIVVFSHYLNQRMLFVIMVLFMILALQPVFDNNSRPVLGKDSIFIKDRVSQYFKNQPELKEPYRQVIEKLPDGCTRVGLILHMDSWEYPLWVLGKISNRRLSLEHVKVENDSKQYGEADFIPCAIIDDTHYPEKQIMLNGRIYKMLFGRSPVSLLTPTD